MTDIALVPPARRGWSIPGGENDDDSTTLYIATSYDGEGRRYTLTIPLSVGEGAQLIVGKPVVEEEV
jgi:hypothetical protein